MVIRLLKAVLNLIGLMILVVLVGIMFSFIFAVGYNVNYPGDYDVGLGFCLISLILSFILVMSCVFVRTILRQHKLKVKQ